MFSLLSEYDAPLTRPWTTFEFHQTKTSFSDKLLKAYNLPMTNQM